MDFDSLKGRLAETNQTVGDLPAGFQVIRLKPFDATSDPLILVEQRGRKGFVHLSEVKVTNFKFEV